ncbi:LAQU0S01e04390g1_1 [Lachancea quebecensis]|uniref:LAQU0S01e04390g1_1 n=1 Tax=Lachancea quebecensis TaxID=1654605 RepID=A0A0P1KLY4_9SACH|nr:LAQU0S01e04390g1_1 [Lachancea quebecensis]
MTDRAKVILLKNKTTPIDPYQNIFEENGFTPVFVPLIEHKHLPNECLTLFQDDSYLRQLRHIVISSQRTVECLNESIIPRLTAQQRDDLHNKVVYTVGPATASFLERCGFKNVRGGIDAGNGDILADLIISELKEEKGLDLLHLPDVLLLVGETRRDIIPKKLTSAGISSRELVTYQTKTLNDNFRRFEQCYDPNSWVVFFSPQGAGEIVEYLQKSPVNIACIGPTTEKSLFKQGLNPTVVSQKPEPYSLLESLKSV